MYYYNKYRIDSKVIGYDQKVKGETYIEYASLDSGSIDQRPIYDSWQKYEIHNGKFHARGEKESHLLQETPWMYYMFGNNWREPDRNSDQGDYLFFRGNSDIYGIYFSVNYIDTKYREERGSLVQSNILAEYNAYPTDGKHTDGYWYVRGNMYEGPNPPTSITLSKTSGLRVGDTITVSWSGASDPGDKITKHFLEVQRNGGSWSSVATKNTSSGSSSHSYTIPSGTTSIQFRAWVENTLNYVSRAIVSSKYTVMNNVPPRAVPVEPKGDLAKIAIVDTINPVLVWRFEDTDLGDAQSSYQVFIVENATNKVAHNSGKIASSQSFYIVPDLKWATRYKWKARVWDKYDLASEYSSYQFFLPKRPPNVTDVMPGSPNVEEPAGTGTAPEFSWTFEDLDQQAQAAYQLRIYDTKDVLIYDSGRIEKTINMHKIPEGILTEGTIYYAVVTVWDPFGLDKDSEKAYFVTNSTPTPPTLTNPANTYRTGLRPTFEGLIGSDKENDPQHFIIQISQDEKFEKHVLELSSMNDRKGWQVSDGSQWYDLPEEGVDNSYEGKGVRYTLQVDLDEGRTYYWRLAAIDANTKARGKWSNTRCIRCGNTLQFKLKRPIETGNTAARRILIAADYYMAQDGINKATMKIEVTNNALDTNPMWEDATAAYQNADYFTFSNTTKTAQQYALDIRVTFLANDSLGAIEMRGLGFSFD
ncbi:glycoside hydrolase family 78 protein [Bacillus chungangensis]|uniref:Fibronectin type-III domain-containing protein n=1 Tax=Bacillus chungangensis TaxID=587633 RepID=A0ABT9WMA0_9BACI|nr:hypothetical protein [Bacillus chungangensis]MDQ0174366.1 hypothetical protein [Bacillus chungangensis]